MLTVLTSAMVVGGGGTFYLLSKWLKNKFYNRPSTMIDMEIRFYDNYIKKTLLFTLPIKIEEQQVEFVECMTGELARSDIFSQYMIPIGVNLVELFDVKKNHPSVEYVIHHDPKYVENRNKSLLLSCKY